MQEHVKQITKAIDIQSLLLSEPSHDLKQLGFSMTDVCKFLDQHGHGVKDIRNDPEERRLYELIKNFNQRGGFYNGNLSIKNETLTFLNKSGKISDLTHESFQNLIDLKSDAAEVYTGLDNLPIYECKRGVYYTNPNSNDAIDSKDTSRDEYVNKNFIRMSYSDDWSLPRGIMERLKTVWCNKMPFNKVKIEPDEIRIYTPNSKPIWVKENPSVESAGTILLCLYNDSSATFEFDAEYSNLFVNSNNNKDFDVKPGESPQELSYSKNYLLSMLSSGNKSPIDRWAPFTVGDYCYFYDDAQYRVLPFHQGTLVLASFKVCPKDLPSSEPIDCLSDCWESHLVEATFEQVKPDNWRNWRRWSNQDFKRFQGSRAVELFYKMCGLTRPIGLTLANDSSSMDNWFTVHKLVLNKLTCNKSTLNTPKYKLAEFPVIVYSHVWYENESNDPSEPPNNNPVVKHQSNPKLDTDSDSDDDDDDQSDQSSIDLNVNNNDDNDDDNNDNNNDICVGDFSFNSTVYRFKSQDYNKISAKLVSRKSNKRSICAVDDVNNNNGIIFTNPKHNNNLNKKFKIDNEFKSSDINKVSDKLSDESIDLQANNKANDNVNVKADVDVDNTRFFGLCDGLYLKNEYTPATDKNGEQNDYVYLASSIIVTF